MTLQDHEIPTVTIIGGLGEHSKDISGGTVYALTSSGTTRLDNEVDFYDIGFSSIDDTELFVRVDEAIDSVNDYIVEILTKDLTINSSEISMAVRLALEEQFLFDARTDVYLNEIQFSDVDRITNEFRINLGTIPKTKDTYVEMFLSSIKYYNYLTDLYCSASGVALTDIDIRQGLGRIYRIDSEIYSAGVGLRSLEAYLCNAAISGTNLSVDLITHSGSITKLEQDIFCTSLGLSEGISCDFKTRSLFVSDFFLQRDHFTTASSVAWIDVIDYLYPIVEEKTYLLVDGVLASGIRFEDIPNGKRLYYDPLNDFFSNGVITYTFHAESSIGEVEQKNFYLLYGYDILLNEVTAWPPATDITVRVEAENIVFCPNKEGEAFKFSTVDLPARNLGCYIRAVEYVDLPVEIYPQSTAFFYGKTYTIKVKNVKDFAGNVMPDFEYTFTIENPKT